MPKKLTKKQIGEIQLTSGWTQDELNDPGVLAIRKQLEDQQRQAEAPTRPDFSNVVSASDTTPAQQEPTGIMGLLQGLDSFINNESDIQRDAVTGGAKRSFGAGLFSLSDNPLVSYVQNTLDNARLGPAGQLAQASNTGEQDNVITRTGGELFQQGSNEVQDAYNRSQQHTSGFGRQLSGGLVDALSSPSSALSVFGGPIGLAGAGGDTSAQEYTSGRLAGLSREDAAKRAGIQGGLEGLFSAIPTGHAFEALVPQGVRRELMGTIPKILAKVGATAGGEAAEETATTAAQLLADKLLAQSDNKELADYANSNLPKNAAGVAEALWRSARAGALSGGAIRTPGALFEAALDNANHAAQIIATGEQAVSERNARKPAPKIDTPKPAAAIPTQGELFGGESSPLPQAPEVPSTTKPMLPAGPDLFPKETAKFLAGRTEAAKLIDKETKNIQATAKSARASARRSFMTKLLADTRDLPKADRVERIASATERWDASNPIESFLERAAAPKAKKGKKAKIEKPAAVSPSDLLNRFDGLAQNSLDNPDSTPPENSGAIEHVFRTMVKKVGKGDTKVLNKMMQDGNLKVVEDPSFIPTKKPLDPGTKGYYDGNTTYIVAKNLDRKNIVGDMLSVAAHETKHAADVSGNETLKANLKGLIGDEANDRLVSKIEGLARKDKIVAKLVEIVKDDHPNDNTYKLELPAYFMNYALDKRNKTFLVKRVMDDAASAVITGAKRKLGIADVSLEDVAYLARSLVKEAAVSGERLTGDVASKINGKGLEMIGGMKGAGYNQALVDDRVYIGRVDKKPRFEFSDHKSSVNSPVLHALRRNAGKEGVYANLETVLNHLELFKQYPQLREYKVVVDNKIGTPQNNANGYFRGGDSKTLAISPKVAASIDRTHSVLLHEVQHAIQEIEGHDPGASPKQFESQASKNAYNEAKRTYDRFLEDVSLPRSAGATLPPSVEAEFQGKVSAYTRRRTEAKNKQKIPTIKELTDFRKDLFFSDYAELSSDRALVVTGRQYREVKDKFNKATEQLDIANRVAFIKYRSVYGETEARTTELRRNLTPEERQLLTPEEDMKYAAGKIPVENTTPASPFSGRIEESVDDSFEERQAKKREQEAVAKMRKAGEVLDTQKDAEEDTAANDDAPEGLAQRVFHGTPHNVDRFSMQKIGTGEGVQAYGWGMYFAGHKSVADYYRRALAGNSLVRKTLGINRNYSVHRAVEDIPWKDASTRAAGRHILEKMHIGHPLESAVNLSKKEWEGNSFFPGYAYDEAAKAIVASNFFSTGKKGNLYQVDIPEDNELLDYDKSMNDQSPSVKEDALKLWDALPEWFKDEVFDRTNADFGELTGNEFYQVLGKLHDEDGLPDKYTHPDVFDRHVNGKEAASHALYVAGIPGLKYADQGSRNKDDKTYNYVIWDENLISEPEHASEEGLAFIPRKYTVGNERVKDALRVAERLLWSGGFTSSTLKEITLHASHLPASLMVKATKYGNDMLSAIDRNAAEAGKGRSADDQRKIRQRLRVDLGKEIERIDALPTRAERDAALDALDRNPRFAGIGQAVRAIRNYKMELTREIIALRSRDPKPLTEKETAIYNKMIENAERYTTRAYLATYNDKIGVKYGKNLWKRFQRDPDSLEGKIVQNALDFLKDHELVIPEEETLHSMGTMQIRRMYENWVGSSTSFKGDKGRRQMIRALAKLPEHTQEEIDAKATEIVKDLLNLNKNKGVSARFYSIGSKQNRTILESRTDMPAELRALMGEITDPFLREAISLQRMINLSAKTKLLTEVFEKGADKGWWSGIKTDGHETQLNDIAYGPMNGKWINSDLEDALTGTILSLESTDKMIADSIHNPTAFSQYLAGKSVKLLTGMSRVQKTYRIVFNLAQMGFNAGGAFLNVGLNGIVNPATAYRGARDALLTLSSEINTKVINENNLPTIQEIVRAGVIDSATVGEFKSQAYQNITEQIQKLDPDQPGYAQQVMHVLWDFVSAQGSIPNAIRQVYAYMDVWTKVATYYDRKNFLTEYNKLEGKKWTEEQIQRRAGYEASGTNISYERAIPLAKIIEKNLPFGMFLTYFSEVPRTIGTSMIQAYVDARMAMDAKNPKAKALARNKAVARFLGTGAVTAGVIAGMVNALGTDDEEEKKRRRLDPNWMQNKYTLPIGLDAEGHEVLFEVNRFDPNGPFNEAMVAVITAPEDKKAEAVYNQVLGLFVPAQGAIAGYRVLHDMLVEAAARATGNASLYDADMASKRTVMERNYPKQFAKLKHVLSYGDFGENIVSMIEQLWLPASAQPLVDQKGRVVTVRPQDKDVSNVPQELGYRPYVRNPDESFDFRIRDYDNAIKAIMKDRGKLLRDADRLDEATLVKELNDMVAREKEAFDTLRYNYEGYMAYQGKTLKDANEHFDSKKLFQQVRYNKFRPRTISPDSLRSWAKQQIKEGRDRKEVKAVYNLLKKAYTESGTDTED